MKRTIICASALAALAIGFGVLAPPAAAGGKNAGESGQAIYKRANCVGCHKWHGAGGGGYGGAALSLRKTQFDKQQIIFTVSCGRPGTGMPYFLHGSYGDDKSKNPCGVTMKELGDIKVAQGGVFLRPTEIAAVADYVLEHIKGKGEPNLADCVAFFGDQSRVCEIYRKGAHHALPIPTTTR